VGSSLAQESVNQAQLPIIPDWEGGEGAEEDKEDKGDKGDKEDF